MYNMYAPPMLYENYYFSRTSFFFFLFAANSLQINVQHARLISRSDYTYYIRVRKIIFYPRVYNSSKNCFRESKVLIGVFFFFFTDGVTLGGKTRQYGPGENAGRHVRC